MTSRPELPKSLSNAVPWDPKPGSIWVATVLSLKRNLSRFSFPNKLGEADHGQVVEQLKGAIKIALPKTSFYSDEDLTAIDRQLIFEHFLMTQGLQQPRKGAGVGIDEDGKTLSLINIDNHLELRAISLGSFFDNAWEKLNQTETALGNQLGFAFNSKFGYLTTDPAECGTGFTASAFLHLPALVHSQQIEGALKNVEDPEVDFQSLTGDIDTLIGDFLIIKNRYTIGMNEETILHSIHSAATKLLSAESVIRDHLKQESSTQVKDQISKGFGLLRHSHKLEIKETLDLLSLMKLGLAIGLIEGVEDEKLSHLFFKCRKGHLARLFPEIKEREAIEQKRADYLQKELEAMTFND